jgi:hypothetical protein
MQTRVSFVFIYIALHLLKFLSETNPSEGVKYWIAAKWSAACKNYVWCPDKQIVGPDVKWKKGFPKTSGGSCVGIHLGNPNLEENGLFNGKCSDIIKYYCIVSEH